MKSLVVGAGATGQVIAHFLYRGGSQVSFFVKEKHTKEIGNGLTLYPQRRSSLGREEHLTQFDVYSDWQDLLEETWDLVVLCVASEGLRENGLTEFLKQGQYNEVVIFQPDLLDLSYIKEFVSKEKIVQGLYGFLAYQTPLPGLDEPPKGGVAYLLLPGGNTYFDGDPDRVATVATLLKDGGMPVEVRHDLAWVSAYRSALVIPLVAALELEEWSFDQFRGSDSLRLGVAAVKEALAVAARFHQHHTPVKYLAISWLVSAGLWSAKHLLGFDLEKLAAYHFTKVGSQTEFMLKHYIQLGEGFGLKTDHLNQLYQRKYHSQAEQARA